MTDVLVLDMFGNVEPPKRLRGRPAHVASPENRQKVLLWLAAGYVDDDIAEALNITTKTLTKHYFHEMPMRRTARMQLEGKNLAAIVAQVDKGNAAAMSLLDKKIERWRIGTGGKVDRPAKPPKLGKKEQALINAIKVGSDSSWGELLN